MIWVLFWGWCQNCVTFDAGRNSDKFGGGVVRWLIGLRCSLWWWLLCWLKIWVGFFSHFLRIPNQKIYNAVNKPVISLTRYLLALLRFRIWIFLLMWIQIWKETFTFDECSTISMWNTLKEICNISLHDKTQKLVTYRVYVGMKM